MNAFVIPADAGIERRHPRDDRRVRADSSFLVPPRVLVLALALAVSVLLLMTSVQADQPLSLVPYTVQSGDTLWSIADATTAGGDDVRETVRLVRDLNGLADSTIHPGQVLRLPAG